MSHHMDLWTLIQQPLSEGYGQCWEKDNINLATMVFLLLFRYLLNPRRTSNTRSSEIYYHSQPWHWHISHISPVVALTALGWCGKTYMTCGSGLVYSQPNRAHITLLLVSCTGFLYSRLWHLTLPQCTYKCLLWMNTSSMIYDVTPRSIFA